MFQPKVVIADLFSVAPQPTPDDLRSLAEQGYKTLISNRPDNEAEAQPTAEHIRTCADHHGLHFIHIPVTLNSISREDIDTFRDSLQQSPTPIVAHCGSGKRAYLLWAAGEVLHQDISVDELVELATRLEIDAKELHHIVEVAAKQPAGPKSSQ